MRDRLRAALLSGGIALLAASCGSDDPNTLEHAEERLRELRSGRIDLELTAAAGSQPSQPVGFGLDGAFDVERGDRYPLLDLDYTRVLGGQRHVTTVRSDGRRVVVEVDGAARELTDGEAAPFAKSADPSDGVTDALSISRWVSDPNETAGPQGGTHVRGRLDAAAMLADLAQLFGDASGQRPDRPEHDAADAIRAAVRESAVDVEVDRDAMLRSLRASVAFAPDVPQDAQPAFGPLGGVTLVLDLRIDGGNEPITPPSLPGRP